MNPLPPPPALAPHLPDVYRFAFLMTGRAATAAGVLRRTLERAVRAGIGEDRDARRVKRWLFAEARHQCGGSPPPAVPAGPAHEHVSPLPDADAPADEETPERLAARFAGVPEAERGALVLFYLYLFDAEELAEVLGIPADDLAPLLTRGRAALGESAAA